MLVQTHSVLIQYITKIFLNYLGNLGYSKCLMSHISTSNKEDLVPLFSLASLKGYIKEPVFPVLKNTI
jgi:hypothetical protein